VSEAAADPVEVWLGVPEIVFVRVPVCVLEGVCVVERVVVDVAVVVRLAVILGWLVRDGVFEGVCVVVGVI